MSCTIEELLKHFNIELDLPEEMLNYEIEGNVQKPEEIEEYHTENADEGTIHVFVKTYKDGEYGDIVHEYILDPSNLKWAVIRKSDDDDEDTAQAYTSISFSDDGGPVIASQS